MGCISTEAKNYPCEPAAHVAIRTVRRFLEKQKDKINAVVFCTTTASDTEIYKRLLPLYFARDKHEEVAISKLPADVGDENGETIIDEPLMMRTSARLINKEPVRRNLLANGLGKTPPMGWNSWNHFYCNINETIVRQAADALVSSGLSKLGYVYVNLDDCWGELNRDKHGNLKAKNTTFPSGIKALADYVHGKGLKLGIYSSAGYYTCSKQMPGSLGHEEQDAKTFASWVSTSFSFPSSLFIPSDDPSFNECWPSHLLLTM